MREANQASCCVLEHHDFLIAILEATAKATQRTCNCPQDNRIDCVLRAGWASVRVGYVMVGLQST